MKKLFSVLLSILLIVSMATTVVYADVGDHMFYERESNDFMSSADRIYNDYTVSGSLYDYDMDYFKFTLSSRSTVRLLSSSTRKAVLALIVDSSDEVIAAGVSSYDDGYYYDYISTTLSAGTYYVVMLNSERYLSTSYLFYIEYGSTHTHSYTTTVVPPTCSSNGYTRYTCSCGYSYTGNITTNGNHVYSNSSDMTCDECGVKRMGAPVAESLTANSVTLVEESGCEYSMDGTNWQSSNVFTGLQPVTEYTFYQRVAQTSTTKAGDTSPAARIETDKEEPIAPAAPVLSSVGYNKVILEAVEGYEYSMDGETWQSSNTFTHLTAETEYRFYQRVAETDTAYASAASEALIVTTGSKPASIYGDANGDAVIDGRDVITICNYLANYDYDTDTSTVEAATGADANGDSAIDGRDVILLCNYLANYDYDTDSSTVVLGPNA